MREIITPFGRTASRACARPSRRARTAALLLATGVWVPAACAEERLEAEVPVDPRVTAVTGGKELYEVNCLGCHGEGALGDGPLAGGLPVKPANIRDHFGDHSFDEMVRRVTEGIPPAMPPAPIGADETRQVLSYVWSLIPDSTQARLRALQELAAEEH